MNKSSVHTRLHYCLDLSLISVGEVPADLDNGLSLVLFTITAPFPLGLQRDTPSSWRPSYDVEL
jgi:hypothetical protein